MRLVGRDKLDLFCKKHGDVRTWIQAWIAEVTAATWRNTMDIKLRFANASFLSQNVVIFNVKGNTYRLETQIAFKTGVVVVLWIGTHADYTKRHA
jgi:mRNA interferase HigB